MSFGRVVTTRNDLHLPENLCCRLPRSAALHVASGQQLIRPCCGLNGSVLAVLLDQGLDRAVDVD